MQWLMIQVHFQTQLNAQFTGFLSRIRYSIKSFAIVMEGSIEQASYLILASMSWWSGDFRSFQKYLNVSLLKEIFPRIDKLDFVQTGSQSKFIVL